MKNLLTIITLVILLASCRSKTVLVQSEPVTLQQRDSVRYEYVEKVRIDTVTVEIAIPAQSAMETVRDSASFLETDFAESRAWLNMDGTLGHSLKNKERTVKGEGHVPVKDIQTETKEIEYKEVPVRVPYAVEVEKKLTNLQQFKIATFWFLVGALALSLGWIFRKKKIFPVD